MLKDRIARSAANIGGFNLLAKVMDLGSIMVLARLLTPEDFGLVALATATMLIATTVTELPVIDVLVQRPRLTPGDIDTAFTLNLMRGLVVYAVMAAAAGPIAWLYEAPALAPMLWVLALAPLARSLESPALVHPLRRVDYRPSSMALVAGKLAGTLTSIACALALQSAWALVLGLVVTGLTSMAWTYRLCPYCPRLRLRGIAAILGFAGWVTISRMLFALNYHGYRYMLGYFIGKAPLGQYTLGADLASLATYTLATPILQPIFAGMARIQSDLPRLRAAYLRAQQALMMLIMPLGMATAALAGSLVPVLLGPGWEQSATVLRWLAPMVALQMLSVPVQAAAMARGRPRALALREALGLALRLPATLYGAWFHGLFGAVVAIALSGLAIIAMNLAITRSLIGLGLWPQLLNPWRSLLAAAAMVAALLCGEALWPRPEAYAPALLRVAALMLGGLGLHGLVVLALWRLAGRPEGAESYALDLWARRGAA